MVKPKIGHFWLESSDRSGPKILESLVNLTPMTPTPQKTGVREPGRPLLPIPGHFPPNFLEGGSLNNFSPLLLPEEEGADTCII